MNTKPTEDPVVESYPTQVWGMTRNYEEREAAVPTPFAEAFFVVTNRNREVATKDEILAGEEDEPAEDGGAPTEHAEVRFAIYETPRPLDTSVPSESAELWFNLQEGAGARVPARHTAQLLNVCVYALVVAGIAWGPKVVLEWTNGSLPHWAVFCVVLLQVFGVGWFAREVLRRKG